MTGETGVVFRPHMFLCSEGGPGLHREGGPGLHREGGPPSPCPFSPLERPAGHSQCSACTPDIHSFIHDKNDPHTSHKTPSKR